MFEFTRIKNCSLMLGVSMTLLAFCGCTVGQISEIKGSSSGSTTTLTSNVATDVSSLTSSVVSDESTDASSTTITTSASVVAPIEDVEPDFVNAESFEAALNAGENCEGVTVRFTVTEFHPESKLGYDLWAGEHLNFVSARHPNVQAGDMVTVRVTTVENFMGSWVIRYEQIKDIAAD